MRLNSALGLMLGCVLSVGSSHAQQLVYQPINPSFGGYSSNTTHLFATANAQKTATARDINSGGGYGSGSGADGDGTSLADLFVRQLQNRLIYALADQVSQAIFGEDPKDSGTVSFGDQKVSFVRGTDSIQLQIIDESTGAITDITVPVLQADTPIN
ncbi:curli production assembly protein CsgF [Pseudovibrio japonicus]|uniref:Curli production assembly/transport component CsgF n=1 Tax=Pseudovibrio japonicus TaxID=366534 RepID=A0ABQ3EA35_9HYPH|nr:curli assembly protein CsgF [Pseudovibrio japonicus]GHB31013.1 curli production assembly protein CsgF [Pseudovibrio japonicus]